MLLNCVHFSTFGTADIDWLDTLSWTCTKTYFLILNEPCLKFSCHWPKLPPHASLSLRFPYQAQSPYRRECQFWYRLRFEEHLLHERRRGNRVWPSQPQTTDLLKEIVDRLGRCEVIFLSRLTLTNIGAVTAMNSNKYLNKNRDTILRKPLTASM